MLRVLIDNKIESDVYKISASRPSLFLVFMPTKDDYKNGRFVWVPMQRCISVSPELFEESLPVPDQSNDIQDMNNTIVAFSKTVENSTNRIDLVIDEFNERYDQQQLRLVDMNRKLLDYVAKKDAKAKKTAKKVN